LAFSQKALRQLWRFGFYLFLSSLLDRAFRHLDVLIIGKLFQTSTLGFYDRAKSLHRLTTQFTSASLMAVLFPALSIIQNDLPRFRSVVLKAYSIVAFVVFMLLGGLYLVANELIVFIFSEKWSTTATFFKITLLSGFGYPLSAVLVTVLSSRGQSKKFFILDIYKSILISINFYVGFQWGIEEFLYGLIIVSLVATHLNMHFASQEIKIPISKFSRILTVQASISICAALIVISLDKFVPLNVLLSIFVKGLLFSILYVAINRFLKTESYIYVHEEATQLLTNLKKASK